MSDTCPTMSRRWWMRTLPTLPSPKVLTGNFQARDRFRSPGGFEGQDAASLAWHYPLPGHPRDRTEGLRCAGTERGSW
jgi:hypothetical protein